MQPRFLHWNDLKMAVAAVQTFSPGSIPIPLHCSLDQVDQEAVRMTLGNYWTHWTAHQQPMLQYVDLAPEEVGFSFKVYWLNFDVGWNIASVLYISLVMCSWEACHQMSTTLQFVMRSGGETTVHPCAPMRTHTFLTHCTVPVGIVWLLTFESMNPPVQ